MQNNKIFQKAKKNLKQRQEFAVNFAKKNLQTALSNKEFAELYKKQKEFEIEQARCEAMGEKFDYSSLEKIKKQELIILKNLNMSFDDFIPHYECNKCNDKGIYEGKYCTCLNKEISLLLLENSGFNKELGCFKNVDYNLFNENDRENARKTFELMKKWCNKEHKKTNIIISGKTGVGKTYLVECMASELIKNQKYICFTTAFNLNQDFLKYHTTFDDDKSTYLDKYLQCDSLFIDDLGTEPIYNNVTLDYLYLVINERIVEQKDTIITTNLDIDELMQRYGERITSRLINKRIALTLQIVANDIRLKKM